jgi:hypothetical protein
MSRPNKEHSMSRDLSAMVEPILTRRLAGNQKTAKIVRADLIKAVTTSKHSGTSNDWGDVKPSSIEADVHRFFKKHPLEKNVGDPDLAGEIEGDIKDVIRRWKLATAAIEKKFRQLKGAPGAAKSRVRVGKGTGFYRTFSNGVIYWHPDTGAYYVHGAILKHYRELGAEGSALKYPTSDELDAGDGVGRRTDFQRGSIYWSPNGGATEIVGYHRDRWLAMGGVRSYLGYPSERISGNETGFQKGALRTLSGQTVEVADTRVIQSGTIHIPGDTAANGWAELTIASNGYYYFRGSMRATGMPSYSCTMSVTFDLRDTPLNKLFEVKESGTVSGTLGAGEREYKWDKRYESQEVKDNFELLRRAKATTKMTAEHHAGHVLVEAGLIISIGGFLIIGAGILTSGGKICGPTTRRRKPYYPDDPEYTTGIVITPADEQCPPEFEDYEH